MGNIVLAGASAAGQTKSGGSSIFLLFIVAIFGFFYFVVLRPQRRRQRQVMQAQRAIVPGMRVRTTAGMYGTITATDDQDVTLEVAPGVEIRFLRRAIMDVISDGSEPGFAGAPPAEAASPDGLAASDGSAGDTAVTEAGTSSDSSSAESAEDERSAP
jgi:preprotein translocase subunit YajC